MHGISTFREASAKSLFSGNKYINPTFCFKTSYPTSLNLILCNLIFISVEELTFIETPLGIYPISTWSYPYIGIPGFPYISG